MSGELFHCDVPSAQRPFHSPFLPWERKRSKPQENVTDKQQRPIQAQYCCSVGVSRQTQATEWATLGYTPAMRKKLKNPSLHIHTTIRRMLTPKLWGQHNFLAHNVRVCPMKKILAHGHVVKTIERVTCELTNRTN